MINRRNFLAAAACAAVPMSAAESSYTSAFAKRIKLAIATYSYWHFRDPKTPIETVIEKAAQIGVEGVDVLHRQMDSEERFYMQKLKRTAFTNGIDLVCLSIHQDFVSPDEAERQKNI